MCVKFLCAWQIVGGTLAHWHKLGREKMSSFRTCPPKVRFLNSRTHSPLKIPIELFQVLGAGFGTSQMRERYKRRWGRNIPHLWTWDILISLNKWGQLVQIKAEKSAAAGASRGKLEIVGEIPVMYGRKKCMAIGNEILEMGEWGI
jgi:hypothetical protein